VVYSDLFHAVGKIRAMLALLNWRLAARELGYTVNDRRSKVLLCGPKFAATLAAVQTQVDLGICIALEGRCYRRGPKL